MSLIEVYKTRVSAAAEERLRSKAREVVRCYRHSWDILSELIQNAVDSINRRYRILNEPTFYLYDEMRAAHQIAPDPAYRGALRIVLDVPSRSVRVEDNGVGISVSDLDRFLLPEESDKLIGREYGFKGYGLTYAAFASREFSLKSKFFVASETYEIGLTGLFDWMVDTTGTVTFPIGPVPIPSQASAPLDGTTCNTVVRVRLEKDYDIRCPAIAALDSSFEYIQSAEHWSRLEYILRSRTAIGNTRPLFNKPPIVPIDVEVEVRLPDGTSDKRTIPYRFYHPREHDEISVLCYDFADYAQKLSQATFNRNFRGLYHTLTSQVVGTRNPIHCDIALLASSSTRLSNIASHLKLDEITAMDTGISYGTYLALNGMPTGIKIDDWKGHDMQRYYVIVDAALGVSDQLDSGRKGISAHYAQLISSFVSERIQDSYVGSGQTASDTFARFAGRFLDHGRVTLVLPPQDFQVKVTDAAQQEQQQRQADAALVQRVRKYSSLSRCPTDEQEVIALFYCLRTAGIVKGYTTLYLSGKATYDAAFDYGIDCDPANLYPNDPLGIGQALVQQLRQGGLSNYDHRRLFQGVTQRPELCVDFKPTIGHFLEEVVLRSGRTNKRADAIDLLVVWDTSIPASVPSTAYTLDIIPPNQRLFHATTQRLAMITNRPTEIRCIVLKEILEAV